jgi:hypothetical protein
MCRPFQHEPKVGQLSVTIRHQCRRREKPIRSQVASLPLSLARIETRISQVTEVELHDSFVVRHVMT